MDNVRKRTKEYGQYREYSEFFSTGRADDAVKRIPDVAILMRDNQWGIPRKRALFISDGPDSTTSGSDILEGHYDRPPEEGYSDVHSTGRPHDVHVAEELCSPSEHLEKAVVRLQQDIADNRAELKLNRTQTPAVSTRHWDSVQTTVEAPARRRRCLQWKSCYNDW